MRKKFDLLVALLGFIIMITLAIMAIHDHRATDLVSAIPATIVGSSLFIAGYISYRNKCEK